jgi:1A family penicillin-binding protein
MSNKKRRRNLVKIRQKNVSQNNEEIRKSNKKTDPIWRDILKYLLFYEKKIEVKNEEFQRKKPKRKKKLWRRVLVFVISLFILLFIGFFIFVAYFYITTPSILELISSKRISQTSIIYDRTGTHVLYELHGEENRKIISHEEIPDNIRIATIAAEDRNFYNHPGIDLKAIIRALKADVESNEKQQGASTITQQLVRNIFLSKEKTYKRKFMEVLLSIKIERNFTKDEILDMYLNAVPYGSNAYGIQAAAQTFLGKNASALKLDEAALLAALPNATTRYSPYGNHTDELLGKQEKILSTIKELAPAKSDIVSEVEKEDTLKKIIPFKQSIEAPHFVFYIKEQLEKQYGKELIENGGLKIYSTLDYNMQKMGQEAVNSGLSEVGVKYNATNAALVAINPKNGEVLAMIGSKDYYDSSIDGQVNVALRPRQPGSSFKPFAYAAAFEKGYQPENLIFDVPTNFGPDGSGKDYTPNNYNGRFSGIVSLRQALATSLNIPAVKVLYLAGINNTISLAKKMGISTLNDKNRYGLALVLGGGEVMLLDETSGFSVFANDGRYNAATPILKITDTSGKIISENKPQNTPVLNQEIARKINSILSDNSARAPVFGTNNKLVIPDRTVAAKTGTTQDFHDAWTVGYTPSIACGVWVGNNNNEAMNSGADGSYVAAPIWNRFMTAALSNFPNESFIDYDKNASRDLLKAGSNVQIKYYNKNTGKEISEEKASKKDANEVEVKLEYSGSAAESGIPLVIEYQETQDPMILRWRQSLEGGIDYEQYGRITGGNSDNKKNN